MAGLNEIENLLTVALQHAPERDRQRLAQAIEDFCDKHPVTWRHLKNSPYAGFMDAMVEGTEAMPGIQEQMRRNG